MTLIKSEVRTDKGDLLTLTLDDISNGFVVQDIPGLDPVAANIVSSSFANVDGAQFQSVRREKRNILYRIGLEPDYLNTTVQKLRTELYRYFMPKRFVNLRFYTEAINPVDIRGMVESFDCPMFVKDPVATVSIVCFDPDFYEPIVKTASGSTSTSTDFGTIQYDGTVDTGVVFKLMVNRPLTSFTIYHQIAGETASAMPITGNFIAGDVLEISTVPGDKYARRIRGGVESSILYSVSPYAAWIKFVPGANLFRVFAEGAAIPFSVSYTAKYGGL